MVRKERLELSHLATLEPKSSVSTNSTTPAIFPYKEKICYYTYYPNPKIVIAKMALSLALDFQPSLPCLWVEIYAELAEKSRTNSVQIFSCCLFQFDFMLSGKNRCLFGFFALFYNNKCINICIVCLRIAGIDLH